MSRLSKHGRKMISIQRPIASQLIKQPRRYFMVDSDAFSTVALWIDAIRSKQISARELLEFHLSRVEAINPLINAIICLRPEQARRQADAADAAFAHGDWWGPFHGIPITIKDTFDVCGMATTVGLKEKRDNIASANAVAVQRLVDAGAIIFGKTNVPEGAADYQTYNKLFGVTNNPWDLQRGAGGSSGGAAAAIAAGLTSMELGSDQGGSLRNPAQYCGIYAHKPTYGIVPMRSGSASDWISSSEFTVAGPLARTAQDLELELDVIVGADPMLMTGWSLNLPKPTQSSLSGFRVAAWLDDKSCPIDGCLVPAFGGAG